MLSFYKLGSKFSLGGTNDPHVIVISLVVFKRLSHAPLIKAYAQANQPESLERIESSRNEAMNLVNELRLKSL
jgi:hypothetical protein